MTTTSSKQKSAEMPSQAEMDSAKEKIVVGRISLLLNQPFFGNVATRFQLSEASAWCPTLATDGRKLYYNSKYVNGLKDSEVVFAVGHELLHAIYDHIGRFGERDPALSNIAADFVTNGDLVEYNIGTRNESWLYEKKYVGWSFEQVYEDLLENAPKINVSALGKGVLDQHLDGSEGDGDGSGDEGGSEGGNGKGPDRLSASEREQIKNELKDAVLSAAQAVGAGNLPSGVKRMIDSLTEPKMNWRELIQQQIESMVKSDYTWMRPSRRGWHTDAILPSMDRERQIDVHLAIDMSGSISGPMIRDFFSEVKGIMDQFRSYKISVLTFDTQVYGYTEFTEDDGDDLLNYEPKGGGGTMFECVWEYFKENEIVPSTLILMTDGYPNSTWGDPDYCETVFLIHNKNENLVAPFGISVQYD